MSTHQIAFGSQNIEYQLQRMPRSTLSITVHPDLSVIVKAPETTDQEEIEKRVYQRAKWILRQQRQFEIFLPDVPPRKYISGESHRYLGRQYRLKVIKSDPEQIKLTRQFLKAYTPDTDPSHVRELVSAWVSAQRSRSETERVAKHPAAGPR